MYKVNAVVNESAYNVHTMMPLKGNYCFFSFFYNLDLICGMNYDGFLIQRTLLLFGVVRYLH